MARRPRLDEPGALHHVWSRGVARCDVFLDDLDRRRFLAIAGVVLREARCRCLAWTLMTNHYHFVVQTGADTLSRVFHRINLRYARSFNVRHGRAGHLFQGRFGSSRVGDDRYLAELIAYVHLNPVRARIVSGPAALAGYPWTGHAALVGKTPRRFHDVDLALAAFGDRRREARRGVAEWVAFVHERTSAAGRRPAANVETNVSVQAHDRIYGVRRLRGRWRFIERVARDLEARGVRHQRFRSRGWTTDAIVARTAQQLAADVDDLRAGRRTAAETRARAVAAYLAWHCIGATQTATARAVGVGGPAVSQCIGRGRRLFGALGVEAEEFLRK